MCFKRLGGFLSLLLILALGCSKGEIPANKISMNIGSTACFEGMAQRFSDFFSGTPAAANIHNNWTCMAAIVTDFVRVTKTDQFQKEDLRKFLSDNYFSTPLSDQVINTTMQLKQVLVGGDLNVITKSEIAMLLQDLSDIDVTTAEMATYASVIFGGDNATVPEAQWQDSYRKFQAVLPKISSLAAQGRKPYLFTDAAAFVKAWADQLNVPADSVFRKIADLMPQVAAAKVLLVAGASDSIGPADWLPLLKQLGTAFQTYKSASRAIDRHPGDISMALAEPNLHGVVESLVHVLNGAIQARSNKQIRLSEITDFLKQLEAAGYFPKAFTVDQASIALQFLVTKVFPAPNAAADALDTAHVAEMQKFVDRWRNIEKAYKAGKASTIPEFAAAIQAGKWTLGLDNLGRIQIPPGPQTQIYGEFAPTFAVLEWLGQKWGTWPMNRDAFHAVIADGLDLLHSFGFLQATDDTISVRLLREANLFMPSSNGNMVLESSEAFQYALFALSSYRSSHALTALVNGKCDPDDFACYQTVLFNNRTALFANLPGLTNYLGSDINRFNAYANDLHTICGSTYLMEFMVANYIETFMQRFDQNGDGLINLSEAMGAYPVYGPVLIEMLGARGIASEDVPSFYTFLFSYGASPLSMFGGSVRYIYWKWHPDSWTLSADRKTLASILAELSKL